MEAESTQTHPADLSDADYQALADVRYQIRSFLHFSEAAAKEEGLEPQQHQLLLALRADNEFPGPTVGTVAEKLMIRPHSAVGLIDRMEARGLVERTHIGEDRRRVRIRLTAQGQTKLKHLSNLHRKELRRSGPLLARSLGKLLEGLRSQD